MKLLLIEDHAPMRLLIRRLVADLVEQISEGGEGESTVTLYARERPDLVLIDIDARWAQGLTAIRQLLAAFPAARVVLLTNYDDEHLRAAAEAVGVAAYVAKDDLLALRALLGGRSGLTAEAGNV